MLNNYFTEIITKTQWKQTYKKQVKKDLDIKEYKTSLSDLKAVMRKLGDGIYKPTHIIDFTNSKIDINKLTKTDQRVINILKQLDYTVSEESYKLGFVKKGEKTVMVNDILNGLDNKKIESMQAAYEKTKKEEIKKQIDILEEYNRYIKNLKRNTVGYKISEKSKYKIVISIQPRLIASQSTEVGWTSCMNLYEGINRGYVGQGIGSGVIVAYITKTGDEKELNSPSARTLLKPYENKLSGKIEGFFIDRVYGTAPNGFEETLDKFFKDKGINIVTDKEEIISDKESKLLTLKKGVYADYAPSVIKLLSKEDKKIIDEINNIISEKEAASKLIEISKKIKDDNRLQIILMSIYGLNDFDTSVLIEVSKSIKNLISIELLKRVIYDEKDLVKKYLNYIVEYKFDLITDKYLEELLALFHYDLLPFVKKLKGKGYKFNIEMLIIISNILEELNNMSAWINFIKSFNLPVKDKIKIIAKSINSFRGYGYTIFRILKNNEILEALDIILSNKSYKLDLLDEFLDEIPLTQIIKNKIKKDLTKNGKKSKYIELLDIIDLDSDFEANIRKELGIE